MFLQLAEINSHPHHGTKRVAVQVSSILCMRPHLEGTRLLLASGVWVDAQESMADILAIIESKEGAA